MTYTRRESAHIEIPEHRERVWRLVAVGIALGAFALLGWFGGLSFGLVEFGGSAAEVRSRAGLVPTARHTPASAVLFPGGYFCAKGPDGKKVRLALTLEELEVIAPAGINVEGPFSSRVQARDQC